MQYDKSTEKDIKRAVKVLQKALKKEFGREMEPQKALNLSSAILTGEGWHSVSKKIKALNNDSPMDLDDFIEEMEAYFLNKDESASPDRDEVEGLYARFEGDFSSAINFWPTYVELKHALETTLGFEHIHTGGGCSHYELPLSEKIDNKQFVLQVTSNRGFPSFLDPNADPCVQISQIDEDYSQFEMVCVRSLTFGDLSKRGFEGIKAKALEILASEKTDPDWDTFPEWLRDNPHWNVASGGLFNMDMSCQQIVEIFAGIEDEGKMQEAAESLRDLVSEAMPEDFDGAHEVEAYGVGDPFVDFTFRYSNDRSRRGLELNVHIDSNKFYLKLDEVVFEEGVGYGATKWEVLNLDEDDHGLESLQSALNRYLENPLMRLVDGPCSPKFKGPKMG